MPTRKKRQISVEKEIEIALEEYKVLWSYYHRTLDERKNLLDWYFKAVTLPAAIISYGCFVAKTRIASPQIETWIPKEETTTAIPFVSEEVLFGLLAAVFLVGLSLLITYAKESANANSYDKAQNKIREFLTEKCPEMKSYLIIDKLRIEKPRLGGIKMWRSSTIMVINSTIGVAWLSYSIQLAHLHKTVSFFLLMAIHAIIYRLMFWTCRPEEQDANKPDSSHAHGDKKSNYK